jgi:hypothetical protein
LQNSFISTIELDFLASGDSIIISYPIQAQVAAIEAQKEGVVFRNALTLSWASKKEEHRGDSYNILYANLGILKFDPPTQSFPSGVSAKQTVRIINSGYGSVSSLYLLSNFSSSEINLDSSSLGIVSNDTIYFKADDFATIGNGNSKLDRNESIELDIYVSGTSCKTTTIAHTLTPCWGNKNGNKKHTSSSANLAITFDQPNLKLLTKSSEVSCLSQASAQELMIINTGKGTALSPKVAVYTSLNTSYNSNTRLYFDTSSLKVNGNVVNKGSFNMSANCQTGANRMEFTLPTIAPGDTITVTWEAATCIPTNCTSNSLLGWAAEINYSDVCEKKVYTSRKNGQPRTKHTLNLLTETPTDIANNEVKKYNYLITNYINTIPSSPNPVVTVKVDLPNGLLLDSVSFNSNGIEWKPIQEVKSNHIQLKFVGESPFNILKSDLELWLKGTCGASGWRTIALSVLYSTDSSCNDLIPLACDVKTTTFVHCPSGSCEGINILDYTLERQNFGLPDNNLDGNPDNTGSLSLNVVKKNRAMVGDTIKHTFSALVSGTDKHRYLGYQTDADYGKYIKTLKATLYYYNSATSKWSSFNPSLSSTITGNASTTSFHFDLSSQLSTKFKTRDSVRLEVEQVVQSSVPNLAQEVTYSNQFFLSNAANPSSSQKAFCTIRNGRITLVGYAFTNTGSGNITINRCSQNVSQNFGFSIGPVGSNYAGGNLFPYEYRNWSKLASISAEIPSGYTVNYGRIVLDNTVKTNQSKRYQASQLQPDTIIGRRLFYHLNSLYENGKLAHSDEGFNGLFQLNLTPDCDKRAEYYEPIDWDFIFHSTAALENDSIHTANAAPDRIKNRPANIIIQSDELIKKAISRSITWDLKIKNESSAVAENSWFSMDIPANIKVDRIELNGVILSSPQTIYEAGTLSPYQSKTIRLYASLIDCSKATLEIKTGYNCSGYPSSLEDYGCPIQTNQLKINPVISDFQTRFTSELMSNPCQPQIDLNIEVSSVEIAHMFDLAIHIQSTDTSKISLDHTSSYYAKAENSYTSIASPAYNNSLYSFDLNTIDSTLQLNGLAGMLAIPNNYLQLKTRLKLGTNYKPGDYINLAISGNNACGTPADTINLALDLNSKFEKNETAGLHLDLGNSWSAAWGDYDNDGYDDLFVPINDLNKPNILYHNNGDGTFKKVKNSPVVDDLGASVAGVWGDYDNDGYLDLFVANNINSLNRLYHNNGDGTFTENANPTILENGIYSHAAAWADYNRDGNLDLVVSDYHPTHFNQLFLGDGKGGFFVDRQSDVMNKATSSVGLSWGDYDNDGDPDLFVANTNGENNQFFENINGILTEVTNAISNDKGNSVGGAWGDYDNDGDLDLLVTNSTKTEYNFFYENLGDKSFKKLTNIAPALSKTNAHGASFIDYDNDGYLDIIIANDQNEHNLLFRNNGDKTFTSISNAITQEQSNSYSTAWSDFDNDGDYDLIVTNRGENANEFFINSKGSCTNHIIVKLKGCNSNKGGVGALIGVKATINGKNLWQFKDVTNQNAALGGQNSSKILFGLGTSSMVDSLVVFWPSGTKTIQTKISANQLLSINEACGTKISGIVFYDANKNGIQDSTEKGIANLGLSVNNGAYKIATNAEGEYTFYANAGNYTIAQISDAKWSQTYPTGNGSHSLNVASNSAALTGNNFGNFANCLNPDLEVTLGTTAMRRGLLNDFDITVKNSGVVNTNQPVSVRLETSSSFYLVDSIWSSVVEQDEKRSYTINFNALSSLSDTILHLKDSIDVYANLEDTVFINAMVVYAGTECDTLNNSFSMQDIIVGSVDPNDKHAFLSPPSYKTKVEQQEGQRIYYKIRFQNLGNYEAQRVEIKDTLSPWLDPNTIVFESSSHSFSTSVKNNILTWVNEDIQLPDSGSNLELSNGYVSFSVCPKNSINGYTLVNNIAYIQFDRNDYIQTNNAPVYVGGNLSPEKLIIYPNPALDYTMLILSNEENLPQQIEGVTLYDLNGRVVYQQEISEYQFRLNLSTIPAGLYILKARAGNTNYTERLMIE